MSAFGPKRTSVIALHMSAFGGKADITADATGVVLPEWIEHSTCPLPRLWTKSLGRSVGNPCGKFGEKFLSTNFAIVVNELRGAP